MLWLLDQGLPRSAASGLRALGEDAVHVGEFGMAEAPDVEILSRAAAEGRIIATLDADFHSLLAHSGESSPSVIRIRDEGLKGPDVVRILMAIADATAADLSDGCVISYSEGRYA